MRNIELIIDGEKVNLEEKIDLRDKILGLNVVKTEYTIKVEDWVTLNYLNTRIRRIGFDHYEMGDLVKLSEEQYIKVKYFTLHQQEQE